MKRWVYLILAVGAVAFLSGRNSSGTDVAKLRPVEVVAVTCTAKEIRIATDAGDWGTGLDMKTAIDDMKAVAPAEIFLETAEYLLVTEESVALLPELMDYLRPSCVICVVEGELDVEKVAQYLKVHTPKRTLAEYRAGIRELPVLTVREGRMELVS